MTLAAPVVPFASRSLQERRLEDAVTGRVFVGHFHEPLRDVLTNDATYLIVKDLGAGPVAAWEATLADVYPNANTGWPTHVFDYITHVFGNRNPHAMARSIGKDCHYTIYR